MPALHARHLAPRRAFEDSFSRDPTNNIPHLTPPHRVIHGLTIPLRLVHLQPPVRWRKQTIILSAIQSYARQTELSRALCFCTLDREARWWDG